MQPVIAALPRPRCFDSTVGTLRVDGGRAVYNRPSVRPRLDAGALSVPLLVTRYACGRREDDRLRSYGAYYYCPGLLNRSWVVQNPFQGGFDPARRALTRRVSTRKGRVVNCLEIHLQILC
jgi:hypothetical protein